MAIVGGCPLQSATLSGTRYLRSQMPSMHPAAVDAWLKIFSGQPVYYGVEALPSSRRRGFDYCLNLLNATLGESIPPF